MTSSIKPNRYQHVTRAGVNKIINVGGSRPPLVIPAYRSLIRTQRTPLRKLNLPVINDSVVICKDKRTGGSVVSMIVDKKFKPVKPICF